MKKAVRTFYTFILFVNLILITLPLKAKEGMWLPLLLEQLNEDDMRSMGLELTAKDIYDINNGSLKDAIVRFGNGCTAEIISEKGLLLTNHHCGYGQIQYHSSVENDYLTNGFWAENMEDELANPGLTATFIIRIEDVTDKVLEGVSPDASENDRADHVKKNIEKIKEQAVKGTHYNALIKPFFYGNKYYMFITETFKDVRLVAAPPSSIGKFGADTDNWMWPRHTGDFSIFRIYASKDNKPAEFSHENVPYKPRRSLTISINEEKEGDFTMVFGFPGRTQEYLISDAVEYIMNKSNPAKISYRKKILDVLDVQMKQSDKIRIQYAAKYARISNYYKKWIGENRGLKKLNAVEVKRKQEEDFLRKINANPEWKEKYGQVIAELKRLQKEIEPLALSRELFVELVYYGPEIFRYTFTYRSLVKEATSSYVNKQLIEKEKQKVLKTIPRYKKDYDKETDMKLFEVALNDYMNKIPVEGVAPQLKLYNDLYKGDWNKAKEKLYSTKLLDFDLMENIVKNFSIKAAKKIEKEPVFQLTNDIYSHYYKVIKPKYEQLQSEINRNMRLYLEALQKIYPEKKFYPDANGTLRLSYGKIEGYSPADGVYYNYYTTMKGMMEKYNPEVEEFNLPKKLIQLYQNKDYGDYATNGEMRVCFIASNHTTGGNSGSPVLDGKGNLIGLNFDRTWESTMSDIMYDPERCRNIAVDMNYLLFIIDKYAGMTRLIEEMNIISKTSQLKNEIEKLQQQHEENPQDAEIINTIGLKYFELGDFSQAEKYFVKAISVNPEKAKYYYNAGTLKAMQNKLPEALKYFTQAIRYDEKYVDAYYNRGKIYADLSKFEEAIMDFTEAIRLKPDYAAAYNNRGVAKNIFLEDKSGCEDIKKAMELGSERAKKTYENWCE